MKARVVRGNLVKEIQGMAVRQQHNDFVTHGGSLLGASGFREWLGFCFGL